MLAALPGVSPIIVDDRPRLLEFADREVIQTLYYQMRKNGAVFRLGEKVQSVREEGGRVCLRGRGGC